jgi:flagellar basal body-associated protein FliL
MRGEKTMDKKIKNKSKNKKVESKRGITLVALVVTIVVLLILAGITINTLLGENGIIDQSKEASEEADKAEEQEAINLATVQAVSRSKNSIEKSILETALKDNIEGKEYTLSGDSEPYIVTFTDSGRSYKITSDGAEIYVP